jgi:hypothetical protein
MASTLQEAVEALKDMPVAKKARPKSGKRGIAEKLCGKYAGSIPRGKTGTEYIRQELRAGLYGKTANNR